MGLGVPARLQPAVAREPPSRLKLMFSATSYPASLDDWKGLFVQRMLQSLASRRELELSAWLPPGPLPTGVTSALVDNDPAWLHALLERGGIAQLLRASPIHGVIAGIALLRRQRRAYRHSDADLFHVNWLQNALALPADTRPAVVTALGSDMTLLRLPLMRSLLRRAFRRRRVVICPNSEWMVPILQRSFGDLAHVECVPFGIDDAWYDLTRAPATDGIDRWLCVSRLTRAKLGHLLEWAEPLFKGNPRRQLHVIGPLQERDLSLPDWVYAHGPATAAELRGTWVPTATGLVSLSRHAEGRPQVMLEAMAAGLPILASRIPAHEDVVEPAATGWLCDDPSGFEHGLAMIEDPANNAAFGDRARGSARARFGTWADCAARYAAFYRTLSPGP